MPAYLWVLVAIGLAVGEIFTGTVFLLAFAVGCVAAAITSLAFPVALQIAALTIGTAVAFFFARPLLERIAHGSGADARTNVDALPGQVGRVLETIDPATGRGRAQIGGDDWRARSASHERIETGSRVVVVEVEGNTLLVIREP
jgi:membrane protein implicated in regulation of membrane protease activity